MNERHYQKDLIKKIKLRWPDAIILKNDPSYMQGVPDLIILNYDKWAMLEIKIDNKASLRPNQEYYLTLLNSMSYASIIYPEIEDEVLYEIQQTFGFRR